MMLFQEEDNQTRLRQQLSKEAVELAVQGRWGEAEVVNREIIKEFPSDVEAHNRLGRALMELGDFARAKEAYVKALELDSNNAIARKNLSRLASMPESKVPLDRGRHKVVPDLFVAEMGKVGMVNLCSLAPEEVLAKLGPGDQVHLRVTGQRLVVEAEDGNYLGEVEPRHALRLVKLMNGGNRYAAAILTVGEGGAQIAIKEVYQDPSQAGHISFPVKTTERIRSHFKEDLLRRSVVDEEGESVEEESLEEEVEYSKGEDKDVPDGFTVLGETNEKGEPEV